MTRQAKKRRETMINYDKTGFTIPEIMLPKKGTDMSLWTCVACDQFTQDAKYWENAYAIRKGCPSAINLMLPEFYLDRPGSDEKIEKINKTMDEYVKGGVFAKPFTGMVLVKRKTLPGIPERTGLVAALDLECYDYKKGSGSLIRATEGTVLSRIPARMKIRKNASLEMPHVMILIDDPEKTVVEKCAEYVKGKRPVYNFALNENGGHLKGYKITDPRVFEDVSKALEKLADRKNFENRYSLPEGTPVLLFAVGDGNHSLASAKAFWEEKKRSGASSADPARYALCEICNIHDPGIIFEPIHRVLFNVDADDLTDSLCEYFGDKASVCFFGKNEKAADYEGCYSLSFYAGKKQGAIYIDKTIDPLAVGALAPFLDGYLEAHKNVSIDYIHGDGEAVKLGRKAGNFSILLPAMDKNSLFPSVIRNGALPRKTFSMGEACEKRYYNECRLIR